MKYARVAIFSVSHDLERHRSTAPAILTLFLVCFCFFNFSGSCASFLRLRSSDHRVFSSEIVIKVGAEDISGFFFLASTARTGGSCRGALSASA